MVDLRTRWLGLDLRSPLVVGASPLCDTTADALRFIDAGAGAIVMHSLFEEQLIADQMGAHRFFDTHVDTDAEARSFLPESSTFSVVAGPMLDRIRALKDTIDVPLVASLNGVTPGGWTHYAEQLEQAGADAIELNLYDVATDPTDPSASVEQRQLEVVRDVVASVQVPVSVKLSPFYTSVPAFVAGLERAGAAGVVMFNRYYQPGLDLETLDLDRHLELSTSAELPLRLHALAIVHGRVPLSLASSGGVHHGTDAAKAILCGADAVQMVSALIAGGPDALRRIHAELEGWLDQAGYLDLTEARGATALDNVADPHTWERLNYARLLQSWHPR